MNGSFRCFANVCDPDRAGSGKYLDGSGFAILIFTSVEKPIGQDHLASNRIYRCLLAVDSRCRIIEPGETISWLLPFSFSASFRADLSIPGKSGIRGGALPSK